VGKELLYSSVPSEKLKAIKMCEDVDMLINLIEDATLFERYTIIRRLGELKSPKSLDILLSAFIDRRERTIYAVIEALINLKLEVLPHMVEYLCDSSLPYSLRQNSALVIACMIEENKNIEQKFFDLISNKSLDVIYQIINIFTGIKEDVISARISEKFDVGIEERLIDKPDIARKEETAEEKRRKLQLLLSTLTNISLSASSNIAFALANYQGAELIDSMFEILEEEKDVKSQAIIIQLIGMLEDPRTVTRLAEYLKSDDSRVRANTIEALTRTKDKRVVKLILPYLHDENNRVKANAAKALWDYGGLRAIEVLMSMLRHQEKWIRASGAYALGEIGVIQVIEPLIEALSDSDVDVKLNAIKALGKTYDVAILPVIEDVIMDDHEDMKIRTAAMKVLFNFKNETAEKFIQRIAEDENMDIRIRMLAEKFLDDLKQEEKISTNDGGN